jgi:glycerophosphoryl diester phosphodiesterase
VKRQLPPALTGKPRPWLMAHRGNRRACPENTLAAFRHAFADGADLLETDLQLTADGEFVCIHDATVDRTTNGSGEVSAMTLRQLQSLRADCGRPEFAGERVPTLAEAADCLPKDVLLALELKSDRFLDPAVAERLIAELGALGVRDRCAVLSFSRARLQTVRTAAEDLPVGWITLSRPWPPAGFDLLGPAWPLLFVNPLYAVLAHRRGQIVCPLDPQPDVRLGFYRRLGCDAVLSDDPGVTRAALDRLTHSSQTASH